MSQQLYEKLLSLIIGFTIFLSLVLTSGALMFLYVIAQMQVYYLLFLVMSALTALYFFFYYQKAKNLKEHLELLIPIDHEEKLRPLNVEEENSNLHLKACYHYSHGSSFRDVKRRLSLKHEQEAKRLMVKGLRFLLKFYDEHKEKKELEVKS